MSRKRALTAAMLGALLAGKGVRASSTRTINAKSRNNARYIDPKAVVLVNQGNRAPTLSNQPFTPRNVRQIVQQNKNVRKFFKQFNDNILEQCLVNAVSLREFYVTEFEKTSRPAFDKNYNAMARMSQENLQRHVKDMCKFKAFASKPSICKYSTNFPATLNAKIRQKLLMDLSKAHQESYNMISTEYRETVKKCFDESTKLLNAEMRGKVVGVIEKSLAPSQVNTPNYERVFKMIFPSINNFSSNFYMRLLYVPYVVITMLITSLATVGISYTVMKPMLRYLVNDLIKIILTVIRSGTRNISIVISACVRAANKRIRNLMKKNTANQPQLSINNVTNEVRGLTTMENNAIQGLMSLSGAQAPPYGGATLGPRSNALAALQMYGNNN
tara:strand:+ start:3507 stop:4667 length:1161 start_codon:yes stop_codon:yes gene_type:complete